jgi:hypothetical protein
MRILHPGTRGKIKVFGAFTNLEIKLFPHSEDFLPQPALACFSEFHGGFQIFLSWGWEPMQGQLKMYVSLLEFLFFLFLFFFFSFVLLFAF